MEIVLFIATPIIVLGILAVASIRRKRIKKTLPNFIIIDDLDQDEIKCICKDVNKCNTWCISKQRFYENPPTD